MEKLKAKTENKMCKKNNIPLRDSEKKKAVFIDRDGTISYEVGYVNHPSRLKLLPNSSRAIRRLNTAGLPAIVVTNQSGVARGYFSESMVRTVNRRLEKLLGEDNARLDAIYYCPHHPTAGNNRYTIKCDCRKPGTGMLVKAAREFNLELSSSYVIGDKISDIEMASRVGAKGILVLTGYGLGEYLAEKSRWKVNPDLVAEDLLEAVEWILEQEGIRAIRDVRQF